jgi:hypothetical protein
MTRRGNGRADNGSAQDNPDDLELIAHHLGGDVGWEEIEAFEQRRETDPVFRALADSIGE